jgi:hypothetical protein
MSKQYIEIDSTYRNRNEFKNPSEFEIDFNTPINEPYLAIDPVSDQAPIIEWDFSFSSGANTISYIDNKNVTVIQTSSDNLTLDIEFITIAPHALSEKEDYYNNVVVNGGTENRRIVKYKYLSTDTNTSTVKAQITLDYPFSTTLTTINFTNPNIVGVGVTPSYIFVPGGGIYDNTYVGYYLYNEDDQTYNVIKDYDSVTHRVQVEDDFTGTLPSKLSIRKIPPSHTISSSSITSSLDGYISSSLLSSSNITANRYLNFIRDTSNGKYYKIISFNKDTHTITGESNDSTTELSFSSPIETPSDGDEIIYNGQTRKVDSVLINPTTVTLNKGFTSTVRLYTSGTDVTVLDGTIGQNDTLTYNGETRNVNNTGDAINSAFTSDIPQYQPVDFRTEEKTVIVTTTGTNLSLSNGGDVYKTFMIGSKVVYKNQTREINGFSNITPITATLDSSFSDNLSNEEVILPSVYKKLDVTTSGNTLTLSTGDSRDELTVDGTITYRGTTRKITSFITSSSSSSSKDADLDYQFSSNIEGAYVTKTDANIPSGTDFILVQKSGINNITYNRINNSDNIISTYSTIEILSTTYDNNSSLQYTGSIISQTQLVCHEIELLHIILPNKVIKHHRGGRVSRHPYIYVELSNVSSGQNRHNIYSNNPHAVKALFKCSIRDISYPVQSPYIKLDGGGMVQTIKFKPTDRLYFRVILSDGSLFKVEDEETFSPLPPNPSIQINAMFSIRKV